MNCSWINYIQEQIDIQFQFIMLFRGFGQPAAKIESIKTEYKLTLTATRRSMELLLL